MANDTFYALLKERANSRDVCLVESVITLDVWSYSSEVKYFVYQTKREGYLKECVKTLTHIYDKKVV